MSQPEQIRLKRIKHNLEQRTLILQTIRHYFQENSFLEVETPLRTPHIAPERYIAPFRSEGHFLITSPELHMKRLVAAGYGKIFQLCRSFRREECGENHQPEFTILEWYRAHGDYHDVIADTEQLVAAICRKVNGNDTLEYRGRQIKLQAPWLRIMVSAAFQKYAGWNPITDYQAERFEIDLIDRVIPAFPQDRPIVLMDYPAQEASLSRLKPGVENTCERAEVFIAGLEIANAFSELTDAAEQKERFLTEIAQLKKGGEDYYELPVRFLNALESMPPCGGIALGIDRLIMLFCDINKIDDVIAFPWSADH